MSVSLSMHKTITLCSIYMPPSYALDNSELDHLLEQLPSPFFVLGDWVHPDTYSKGHKLEKGITYHELSVE